MTTHQSQKAKPSTDLPPLQINPNRIELDEAYMQMAEIWAQRSKAVRAQVGCLIVNNEQIVSDGYNGMPHGCVDDVCEEYQLDASLWTDDPLSRLMTKEELLHAEPNALMKLAKNPGVSSIGSTLYVTMSPCKQCSKLIIQGKVKRVVYRTKYRDASGLDLLQRYNVEVTQL